MSETDKSTRSKQFVEMIEQTKNLCDAEYSSWS